MPAMPDLSDPELREELARAAYYRERFDDMTGDREHELDEAQYFCLQWEALSAFGQRPYRTAVSVTLDHVQKLVGVG